MAVHSVGACAQKDFLPASLTSQARATCWVSSGPVSGSAHWPVLTGLFLCKRLLRSPYTRVLPAVLISPADVASFARAPRGRKPAGSRGAECVSVSVPTWQQAGAPCTRGAPDAGRVMDWKTQAQPAGALPGSALQTGAVRAPSPAGAPLRSPG